MMIMMMMTMVVAVITCKTRSLNDSLSAHYIYLGVKRPGREAVHSYLLPTLRMSGNYTSATPYALMRMVTT